MQRFGRFAPTTRTTIAAFVTALCAFLPHEMAAQTCSATLPPLGSVVPLAQACPQGPGPLPGATCQLVQVQCAGLMPLVAQLRIIPPSPATTERGTVVFGSGGAGTGFYPNGDTLFPLLTAMGFRIVDRSWAAPGWTSAEAGLRVEACRYATLITWIAATVHVQGAFCISGNSGGSAEAAYALTTWQRDSIVDLAIPTSGPAVTRLDYECGVPTPAAWTALCPAIVPPGFLSCTPTCTLGPGNSVCTECGPNPTLQDLLADSVMHPAAQIDYPNTRVHFLYAAMDCGQSVPVALLWSTKVTSEKVIEFVPNTPHTMSATTEGREAIRRALDNGTPGGPGNAANVLPHGVGCGGLFGVPAIQAYGTPYVGNPYFLLAVEGAAPITSATLFVSTAQAQIAFGNGCTAWIDPLPPALVLPAVGSPTTVATTALGYGYLAFAIPLDPALIGVSVFTQWGVLDPSAPGGVSVTRALEGVLGTH